MKADVELRVGKRERDGLPLVYTMDAKWIALDSTNEEGPTFARRCTSVSAVVDMGSSEACELILDAASPSQSGGRRRLEHPNPARLEQRRRGT